MAKKLLYFLGWDAFVKASGAKSIPQPMLIGIGDPGFLRSFVDVLDNICTLSPYDFTPTSICLQFAQYLPYPPCQSYNQKVWKYTEGDPTLPL